MDHNQDWLHQQEQSFLNEPSQDITCAFGEGECHTAATTNDSFGDPVCDNHLLPD